jgi:hypothetical protein
MNSNHNLLRVSSSIQIRWKEDGSSCDVSEEDALPEVVIPENQVSISN